MTYFALVISKNKNQHDVLAQCEFCFYYTVNIMVYGSSSFCPRSTVFQFCSRLRTTNTIDEYHAIRNVFGSIDFRFLLNKCRENLSISSREVPTTHFNTAQLGVSCNRRPIKVKNNYLPYRITHLNSKRFNTTSDMHGPVCTKITRNA